MKKEQQNDEIVIDASGGVLGRIAAYAAKQSLLGKPVIVVNCDEARIIGAKQNIVEKYRTLRAKGGSSLKGPKISKVPEKLMKRTIRGMLSHRQARGRQALKRIICYNSVPEEFTSVDKISLKKPIKHKSISLQELSKAL